MRKLLFLGACLWALAAAPARAQTTPASIIVVRIYEGANVTAIITRGEGKSEKVEFPNGFRDKSLTQTGEGYHKLVQQLYNEGYVLQSTFGGGSTDLITLIFVRKQ